MSVPEFTFLALLIGSFAPLPLFLNRSDSTELLLLFLKTDDCKWLIIIYFLDNTAGIFTAKSGFRRQEQFSFSLPILILDNGTPPLTSTNTLTITVCDCDTEVNVWYCRYGAFMYAMGLSTEALVAVLACILILLGKYEWEKCLWGFFFCFFLFILQ